MLFWSNKMKLNLFAAILIPAFAVSVTFAGDGKPACCGTTEEVKHVDDKHDDKKDDHKHDDHAGHDHGGGLFDVVKKDGSFNTLAAALGQAELEETLSHDEWTLFAPTDEAFAKLPQDKLDALLNPDNKAKLKALLLAHVVKGALPAAKIESSVNLKSESGSELAIKKDAAGAVIVGAAKVVKADIAATNGVIHAIDQVIIPAGLLD
jgi:uncharacterized surface protein with fasciclin (FAS1) repeats